MCNMKSSIFKENFAYASDLRQIPVEDISAPQRSAIEPTGTFSRAIMVEAPGYVVTRSIHCAISLLVHFGAILLLLALPLIFSGESRWVVFNAPELVSVPMPPPRHPPGFRPHRVYGRENRLFSSVKLMAPTFNTDRFLLAAAVSQPDGPLKTLSSGTPGGIGNVLGGILEKARSPLVAPFFPAVTHAFPVGGDLRSARLVSSLSLEYPTIARMAHVSGTVVIEADIDETGHVTNVHATSGNLLLVSAAIDAVSRERFQPAILNGLRTRCSLTVEVTFRLRS